MGDEVNPQDGGTRKEAGASGSKKSKGGSPQKRFQWLRVGLLNVVFLVAPFGVWYFMHVQDQIETNTIRMFRALGEIDATLAENLNNLPNIWRYSDRGQRRDLDAKYQRARKQLLELSTREGFSYADGIDAFLEQQLEIRATARLNQEYLDELSEEAAWLEEQVHLTLNDYQAAAVHASDLKDAIGQLHRGLADSAAAGPASSACTSAVQSLQDWLQDPSPSGDSLDNVIKSFLQSIDMANDVDSLNESMLSESGLLARTWQSAQTLLTEMPSGADACVDGIQAQPQQIYKGRAGPKQAPSSAAANGIRELEQAVVGGLEAIQRAIERFAEAIFLKRERADLLLEWDELAVQLHGFPGSAYPAQFSQVGSKRYDLEKSTVDLLEQLRAVGSQTTSSPGKLTYVEVIKQNPALSSINFEFDDASRDPAGDDCSGQALSLSINSGASGYKASVGCLPPGPGSTGTEPTAAGSSPATDSDKALEEMTIAEIFQGVSESVAKNGGATTVPAPITLVEVSIDDVLKHVVSSASAHFDHVMLASQDGRIISRARTRVLRDAKQTGAIASDPFRYDYFNYSNLKPILENSGGCSNDEDPLVSEDASGQAPPHAHAVTCGILVGKTRFTLFIQPSSLDVKLDRADSWGWYVIGVVRDSELRSQSMVAPLSVTGPVLVLIVMALAGLPLLWLSTKSRRALLSTTHFSFALGGGIIILALAAILSMHLLYVRDTGLQRDVSLQEMHARIHGGFLGELDSRLGALNQALSKQNCTLEARWDDPGFPPFEVRLLLGQAFSEDGQVSERGVTLTPPISYRHYSPPAAKLGGRQYYQKPALGESWTRNGHPFYIERIRSFVDGVKDSVLAIPVPTPYRLYACSQAGEAEVLAEIQPFLSLTHVAMQPHHGFAVVESNTGRVLYHSSNNRSLEENFIDETDGDQHLISLLQSRTDAFLDLQYHGRTVRAYANAMESVPWTLVTFMDDEIVDTVLLETLITAAGLVICYAFALMMAFWLYARVFDRLSAHRSLQWLWPNPQYAQQYPALILGVLVMSALFIYMSVADSFADSTIHQLFFLIPLVALLLARFVFKPDLKDSAHRLGGLLILAIVAAFAWINRRQDGAWWAWGLTLLAVVALLGLVSHHLHGRGRKGKPIESRLSHVSSMLPLVAVLIYTGPLAGVIFYLSVFEAFGQSYSHYSDDQIMRAIDLGEQEYRGMYRRYYDNQEQELPPPIGRYASWPETEPGACLGTYIQSGPFLTRPMRQANSGATATTPSCPWSLVDPAAPRHCPDIGEKRALNENWVSWFVASLPAFSYESGALKQAARDSRDSDRLCWFDDSGAAGGRTFQGRSLLRPEFMLAMDASDFSFGYHSRQDVDPSQEVTGVDWLRLSVISSVLFFAILIATILYAIARSFSLHLFGSNLPVVEFNTIGICDLPDSELRAHVLISPLCVLHEIRETFPGARVFSPHSWRNFQPRNKEGKPGLANFSESDVLVVDETETTFYIAEQRRVLLDVLEAALAANARVVMLTRVDPVHWLDTLDARSMAEAEALPISQDEVIVWSSLMSRFRVAQVSGCTAWSSLEDAWKTLTQAQAHHEHMRNWAVSSRYERNMLANLALADLYNPRNSDEIYHLVRRGLVSDKPPYQLRNSGFKAFILSSAELEPLKGWRKEGSGSLWSALWPTLLVIIGLLMFFVVSAGQNTVKTALALLASIVATLPVLMSVFAFARNNSRG